jgi:hypothetical protein
MTDSYWKVDQHLDFLMSNLFHLMIDPSPKLVQGVPAISLDILGFSFILFSVIGGQQICFFKPPQLWHRPNGLSGHLLTHVYGTRSISATVISRNKVDFSFYSAHVERADFPLYYRACFMRKGVFNLPKTNGVSLFATLLTLSKVRG